MKKSFLLYYIIAGIKVDGTHEAENCKCIIDADTRPEGGTETQDTGKRKFLPLTPLFCRSKTKGL
jgi:hypothetical protein